MLAAGPAQPIGWAQSDAGMAAAAAEAAAGLAQAQAAAAAAAVAAEAARQRLEDVTAQRMAAAMAAAAADRALAEQATAMLVASTTAEEAAAERLARARSSRDIAGVAAVRGLGPREAPAARRAAAAERKSIGDEPVARFTGIGLAAPPPASSASAFAPGRRDAPSGAPPPRLEQREQRGGLLPAMGARAAVAPASASDAADALIAAQVASVSGAWPQPPLPAAQRRRGSPPGQLQPLQQQPLPPQQRIPPGNAPRSPRPSPTAGWRSGRAAAELAAEGPWGGAADPPPPSPGARTASSEGSEPSSPGRLVGGGPDAGPLLPAQPLPPVRVLHASNWPPVRRPLAAAAAAAPDPEEGRPTGGADDPAAPSSAAVQSPVQPRLVQAGHRGAAAADPEGPPPPLLRAQLGATPTPRPTLVPSDSFERPAAAQGASTGEPRAVDSAARAPLPAAAPALAGDLLMRSPAHGGVTARAPALRESRGTAALPRAPSNELVDGGAGRSLSMDRRSRHLSSAADSESAAAATTTASPATGGPPPSVERAAWPGTRIAEGKAEDFAPEPRSVPFDALGRPPYVPPPSRDRDSHSSLPPWRASVAAAMSSGARGGGSEHVPSGGRSSSALRSTPEGKRRGSDSSIDGGAAAERKWTDSTTEDAAYEEPEGRERAPAPVRTDVAAASMQWPGRGATAPAAAVRPRWAGAAASNPLWRGGPGGLDSPSAAAGPSESKDKDGGEELRQPAASSGARFAHWV